MAQSPDEREPPGPQGRARLTVPFHASERASLGVEMEVGIVDDGTGELVTAASEVLEELGRPHPEGAHPKAKHELFECTVEAITGICTTVAEARADLGGTLDELTRAVESRGLGLLCAGTHPYTGWSELKVSPQERYSELVEALQWPARRLAIHGIHFHVGVRSPEKAIAITNALTVFLPHFLALSASSPYWHGHDTGLASARTKVFEGLPTAGLPPSLDDWSDFERFMATLLRAEAIHTIREVWWDVRPHPDFGTVELRMCDGMPTLLEVSALAALAQSLVEHLDRAVDRGEAPRVHREWVKRENKWLAARYGIEALVIRNDEGDREPLQHAVAQLVEEVMPTARQLGCAEELDLVRGILDHGPSYVRQRRVVEAGGTLPDVVDALRRELATDRPGA